MIPRDLYQRDLYKEGLLDGECKIKYENGRNWEHAFWKSGHINGKYKYWLNDGSPYCLEFFRYGSMEGESKTYFGSGHVHGRFFRNGKTIDNDFTLKKKMILLKLKKCLYGYIFPDIDSFLIDDLKIIIQ